MNAASPLLSVVVPAYNRIDPLRHTLKSISDALVELHEPAELLLVDDGSTPALVEQLAGEGVAFPITHLRQDNAGSIAARMHGLRVARGEYVQFVDSDDLVHPRKFIRQLAAQKRVGATVSCCTVGAAVVAADGGYAYAAAAVGAETTMSAAELLITRQAPPHAPIYRRDFLLRHLERPVVPQVRRWDSVGDIWIIYNLAAFEAGGLHLDEPLCAIAPHDDARFSQHWEQLAVEALLLVEVFMTNCPRDPAGDAARKLAARAAFQAWRRLPRDFDAEFDRRLLALWQANRPSGVDGLGGRWFERLARAIGAEPAGHLLRWRNADYRRSRTLDDERLRALLARLATTTSDSGSSG